MPTNAKPRATASAADVRALVAALTALAKAAPPAVAAPALRRCLRELNASPLAGARVADAIVYADGPAFPRQTSRIEAEDSHYANGLTNALPPHLGEWLAMSSVLAVARACQINVNTLKGVLQRQTASRRTLEALDAAFEAAEGVPIVAPRKRDPASGKWVPKPAVKAEVADDHYHTGPECKQAPANVAAADVAAADDARVIADALAMAEVRALVDGVEVADLLRQAGISGVRTRADAEALISVLGTGLIR